MGAFVVSEYTRATMSDMAGKIMRVYLWDPEGNYQGIAELNARQRALHTSLGWTIKLTKTADGRPVAPSRS